MPPIAHHEEPSGKPPIVQYWDSEAIPGYIAELLATYPEHNPDMQHLVFSERTAAEFLAEHFGRRHLEAFQTCAVPAMQADYFRYCAVYALGGVYADADFACARSLRPLVDAGDGHLFKEPDGPVLNGLFAFRSPGHPLLAMAVEIATGNIESRVYENVAMVTGPVIFSGLLGVHQAGSLDALGKLADARLAPLAEPFRRAIEEHGPIAAAFEGVQISTRAEMLTWVDKPDPAQLPYKDMDDHWQHRKSNIFRSRR